MYTIERNGDRLLVNFLESFDYDAIREVIHHVTMLKEYPHTNDIWLIGKHQANLRLHELESMVKEFQCRCPRDATRTKTAIVAEWGTTRSILEIWANALRKRISFELKIFQSLEKAEEWMGIAETKVA
ncbi:MAG: hypothetical protein ABFR47_01870 [Verrucomicrobiota bacterium]